MTQEEYLLERVDRSITWYSKRALLNKRLSTIVKISVIVLAASITVLSQIEYEFKNVSLAVMASLIAVLTGVSDLLKVNEKWIKYRKTAEALKHEKFLFKGKAGAYDGLDDPFKNLVTRIENLISNENAIWGEYVEKSK